jgi:hypothetical protein
VKLKQVLYIINESVHPNIYKKIDYIYNDLLTKNKIEVSSLFDSKYKIYVIKDKENNIQTLSDSIIIKIEFLKRNREEIKSSIYHEIIHALDYIKGNLKTKDKKNYDKKFGYLKDPYEFNQIINQLFHSDDKELEKDIKNINGISDMKLFFEKWFGDEFNEILDDVLVKKFLIRIKRELLK